MCVLIFTGLAINGEGNLMTIDTGTGWPPKLVTYSQDGQLICSAPILPLSSCTSASGSKCRFMECADNSVFIVDLGTLSLVGMPFFISQWPKNKKLSTG